MMKKSYKNVFVTVGTTRFDKFLAEIDSVEVQKALLDRFGTRTLVVQIGNGSIEPKCTNYIMHDP
jgi:UDP-N-acetylglucosamine transferase subunit ALG13